MAKARVKESNKKRSHSRRPVAANALAVEQPAASRSDETTALSLLIAGGALVAFLAIGTEGSSARAEEHQENHQPHAGQAEGDEHGSDHGAHDDHGHPAPADPDEAQLPPSEPATGGDESDSDAPLDADSEPDTANSDEALTKRKPGDDTRAKPPPAPKPPRAPKPPPAAKPPPMPKPPPPLVQPPPEPMPLPRATAQPGPKAPAPPAAPPTPAPSPDENPY